MTNRTLHHFQRNDFRVLQSIVEKVTSCRIGHPLVPDKGDPMVIQRRIITRRANLFQNVSRVVLFITHFCNHFFESRTLSYSGDI